MQQKDTVKHVFTQAADSYASRKGAADRISHEYLLKLSQVKPTDRVLDVATGPGYVAMLFAEKAKEIVGVDLTPAFVAKAQAASAERGLKNVSFCEGDVEKLPFANETFEIVTCHKALHHFPNASKALKEMYRVLTRSGRLVLGDTRSSDNPETARRHNELEKLRDPSHVEMYGPKKLRALIEAVGFRIEQFEEFHDEKDMDWWQQVMPAPEPIYREIRDKFVASIPGNTLELNVRVEGEKVFFTRRHVVVSAIKP
ncbi:methyltransferase domain-containing protein [Candidatus Acetothermia bacterium]|nr:methyltransferase domain-containing protein [Candidatus Acetothermia bacterium]